MVISFFAGRENAPQQRLAVLTTLDREPNEAREQEVPNWGLTARDFTRVAA